jgi:hypothetical protein
MPFFALNGERTMGSHCNSPAMGKGNTNTVPCRAVWEGADGAGELFFWHCGVEGLGVDGRVVAFGFMGSI